MCRDSMIKMKGKWILLLSVCIYYFKLKKMLYLDLTFEMSPVVIIIGLIVVSRMFLLF